MQTHYMPARSIPVNRFRVDEIHETPFCGSRSPLLVRDGAPRGVAEPHFPTCPDCFGDVERAPKENFLSQGDVIDDKRNELEQKRCPLEGFRANDNFDAIV